MNEFRKNVFWLLVIVSASVSLPMFATDIYISSLPILSKHFNTNEYWVKLSLNIYMLGFACAMLIAAIFSGMISKYKIMLAGIFLFITSSFLIATTNLLSLLIIGRGLQGIGAATGTVLARLMIKDNLHETQGFTQLKALNIVAACMSLSPLIGPTLGATLTRTLGWQSIFYLLGGIAVLLFVAVYQFSKNTDEKLESVSLNFETIKKTYKDMLQNRKFLIPTIAISLACSSEFIFISNSPFFYQNILHFSSLEYSLILSVVLSGYLLGSYFLNREMKKGSPNKIIRKTIKICFIATILPFIGLLAGKTMTGYLLIFSTIITMAGVGVIIPIAQAAALNISKSEGTAIVGLFFFIEFICIGVLGYFISLFNSSLSPMLIGICACWFLTYLVVIFIKNNDEFFELQVIERGNEFQVYREHFSEKPQL